MARLLEVSELTKVFGGLVANHAISLACDGGEVLGIIGPNGAGKTTLLNCINGQLRPDSGEVVLAGRSITGQLPHFACQLGIARTFQIVQVVDAMTVLANVMVGAFLRFPKASLAQAEAEKAIEFVGIQALTSASVGSLTLAQKRKVEFARALATRPQVLLLDELLAGLTTPEIKEMTTRIKQVRDQGIAVLWIEHVMEAIMPVANRIFMLCFGEKLAEGKPAEIAHDRRCIEAYLGEECDVES
jgi:branched-chain amino acid transport system ATP-binding protein